MEATCTFVLTLSSTTTKEVSLKRVLGDSEEPRRLNALSKYWLFDLYGGSLSISLCVKELDEGSAAKFVAKSEVMA